MKKLVYAEKESVAKTYAEVLGVKPSKVKDNHGSLQNYYQNDDYLITWAYGHLVENDEPEDYDEKLKKWELDTLPIIPQDVHYHVLSGVRGKQYHLISWLLSRNDVSEVINGGDAGREGEFIFRLIYNLSGSKKPIKRLWVSSLTKEAVEEGFKHLEEGEKFDPLYQSASVRSQADWLVGINGTRLYSTLYHNFYNVGRVATPTLSLIVERDKEIDDFVSRPFYQVQLKLDDLTLESERFDSKEEAEDLIQKLSGHAAVVTELSGKNKVKNPPLLFNLIDLQKEANKRLGFSAKETLDATQKLYEKRLVSYPRSESRYLTHDMLETLKQILAKNPFQLPLTINETSFDRLFNDQEVEDHHAIIPTTEDVTFKQLKGLEEAEFKIYSLIVLRTFLAVSMPQKQLKTSLTVTVNNYEFKKTLTIIQDEGYERLEREGLKQLLDIEMEKSDNPVIALAKGQRFENAPMSIKEGKTTPKSHYTEATLLAAMEKAGTKALDKRLDVEKKGLGTSATRDGIIESLLKENRGGAYVKRDHKYLLSTEKGKQLIALVDERLKNPEMTANWENELTKISKGTYAPEAFLKENQELIKEIVDHAKATHSHFSSEELHHFSSDEKEVIGQCPRCGSNVLEAKTTFYCSNRDCDFYLYKKDNFFVWKKKTITKTIAKDLLQDGKAFVKGWYSSKTDKNYDASVVLSDDGEYVHYALVFD